MQDVSTWQTHESTELSIYGEVTMVKWMAKSTVIILESPKMSMFCFFYYTENYLQINTLHRLVRHLLDKMVVCFGKLQLMRCHF